MTTTLPCWRPTLSLKPQKQKEKQKQESYVRLTAKEVRAFKSSDFGRLRRCVESGEAWRSANEGLEQLIYETKKTAERIDRRFHLSRRLSQATESASVRARELDRDYELTLRWRSFSLDFSRNFPKYRKQLNDFLNTPVGRSFATVVFLWFALSGWLFRILIFSTWVLPFAGPLLIGAVANNFVIKGNCPNCKRQFVGSKNQIIRCTSCGNIVWQPQGSDFFSRDGKGRSSPSKSDPDIIDVDFEEK